MPFKKGVSGNPNGRTKGTPNAITRELRQRVQELLEKHFDKVAANIEALEPKEQIAVWLKLAEFVLPKLQRTEMDVYTEEKENVLDRLPIEKQAEILRLLIPDQPLIRTGDAW